MNRQDFYLTLALELNNLKVPPELINTHIDQFKQYLQTLTEADAEKQIASFGDVKSLAANIYRLLCGGENAPEPIESAPQNTDTDDSVYDAFRVEEKDDDIVNLLEAEAVTLTNDVDISQINDIPTVECLPATDEIPLMPITDENAANEPSSLAVAQPVADELTEQNDLAEGQISMDFGPFENTMIAPDPSVFDAAESAFDTIAVNQPTNDLPIINDGTEEPFTEFTFDDLPKRKERSTGGTILFYSLFILTLPLTLSLFITSMALFGAVYIILGVLTGLFFSLIFGTAILGSLFALSSGLYGVGQINAGGRAIGLFELGLALIIIGVTIFTCYLFSAVSLKWLPALLKYHTRFLKYYLRKLITLFKYLKGRCEQI